MYNDPASVASLRQVDGMVGTRGRFHRSGHTLHTWERYMGGTLGHGNFPNKYKDLTDIRNVLDFMFGLNRMYTLPGLEHFFFTGQWVTSMGSLFANALTVKTVVQRICKQCGASFREPS
jgi:hypothetical protein